MRSGIRIYEQPDQKELDKILSRPKKDQQELREQVARIIEEVRVKKDEALKDFSERFDGCRLEEVCIPVPELEAAAAAISQELRSAIDQAHANISAFHASQVPVEEHLETEPGVHCWRAVRPIERVGIYIPGGTAPLFSTVLMLAIPAKIAGCSEIVLATPLQKDGSIHPAVLYSAVICGVTRIIASGGAQAIAALAYGTESVPKVDKIFGPGNQYVTMAKQLVSVDETAIDMPAGPSEVLVIADGNADAAVCASDLLSQAEHGSDSQVLLLTDSSELAQRISAEVDRQAALLPRAALAVSSLANSSIVITGSIEEAFEISNAYAPEHLILNIDDPEGKLDRIAHAGSVFLGPWTPESAGDYASGTNHTLPTSGWARTFSGVSLDSYIKKITFQKITEEGLSSLGPAVMEMAEAESLHAHKMAVAVRLERIGGREDE